MGVNASSDAEYLEAHQELIEGALLNATMGMPTTVATRWRLLNELPQLILSKEEPWDTDCCLAFIGYGENELFPGHQTVVLHGIVNDQVRSTWWPPASVDAFTRSLVSPFGQDEAIDTFLRAFNQEFLTLAHKRLDHLVDEFDSAGVLLPEEADPDEVTRLAHEGLEEDFKGLSQRKFIEPMLDTVESLPRADMARMAEALVGVQALRAASTRRQPTVGGPIDVVVISRRHGVQWIRRKELTLD